MTPVTPGLPDLPFCVAIIGSGPSGFYAASALLKSGRQGRIDMFDRLPTPYGLVRGGVAPDHQKIKNVIRVYSKTAEHQAFRFFGNVAIGRDLAVDDLLAHYHQVVLAVGNEADRALGIPGEDLDGVYSATEFVGWYNGHPDFQERHFPIHSARRVAVVGNGNVAMDVVRILSTSPEELAGTDITGEALAALRSSNVREVTLLGRRGPAQAAFSPKEIKEVGSLGGADLVVSPGEMELDPVSMKWLEQAPPSAQKNVDYLVEASQRGEGANERKIRCRFLVSPIEILGDQGRVTAVRLEKNVLSESGSGQPRAESTGETEDLPVDLLFKAVGYRGEPLAGVPFDERRGIIPNAEGRVLKEAGGSETFPRLYVVGWAKRGPSGLIGTNGPDSEATVAKMIEDLETFDAESIGVGESAPQVLPELLRNRGVDFVSFADWRRLDEEEIARGQANGKVREKYCSIEEMMAAVRRLRVGN